jgi:hypothetical protein
MAYRRVLEKRSLSLWALVPLLAAACTSEEIVLVEPAFVDVTPPEVSAIAGDRVQLVGTVHDEEDDTPHPRGDVVDNEVIG